MTLPPSCAAPRSRARVPRGILLLALLAALGAGCGAGAPARGRLSPPAMRPEGPGGGGPLPQPAPGPPGFPAPPPPSAAPAPAPAPPPAREGRAVRVLLLEGRRSSLDLSAGRVRVVDGTGGVVGEWPGSVTVAAEGDRLRVGGGPLRPGPVEAAGYPALSVGGRRVSTPVLLHARGGSLLAVAHVPLEGYVASVLSREAAPSFREEALKAMAVAIRSYTVSSLATPRAPEYDLLPGVEDQVFDGDHAVPRPFAAAAAATAGTVLLRDGAVARTVYHSTCGGRTEGAADAWEKGGAWPPSVPCEDCRHSPAWRWVYRMEDGEALRVLRSLGVEGEREPRVEVKVQTPTGRAARLLLSADGKKKERREVRGADFRRAAGYGKVKSLAFDARRLPGGLLFSGKGYGHGAGLCQWGADGMARRGSPWGAILGRYYPGSVAGPAPSPPAR